MSRVVRSLEPGVLVGSVVGHQLYQNAQFETIWGDSGMANTYPPGIPLPGTGNGQSQSLTVFGLISNIPIQQATGAYQDVVVATVNF